MSFRVLVTGAAGLLGAALVRCLAKPGRDVIGSSRSGGAERLDVGCDLANTDAVSALVSRAEPDAIVHAAGRIRPASNGPESFERDNVVTTANLLGAARSHQVTCFIHVSTISVYSGDGPYSEDSPTVPLDRYGQSKRRAEEICLSAASVEFRPVILRLGGLHGYPRKDGVVAELFRRGHAGQPLHVSEPKTVTTLTFIDDVIAVVDRILDTKTPAASAVFNVATREAVSLHQLAEMIRDLTGGRSDIVQSHLGGTRNRIMDCSRIRRWIGLPSVPLSEHLVLLLRRLCGG